jgi:hypothetical protein
MAKIWAICGGGDWADASVDHIILPEGVTMEEMETGHRVYSLARDEAIRSKSKVVGWWVVNMDKAEIPKYISLVDWALSHGARRPKPEELEEHWEV